MKYINQLDYSHWLYTTQTSKEGAVKERGKTTTVRSSGCGLCSAVMVADRLLPNCEFGLKEAIDLAYASNANFEAGVNYQVYAPAFAEKLGFQLLMTNDIDQLLYCLRTGGAAVLNVGGDYEGHVGVFSHGGHYIVAIGAETDSRIVILDPSYKVGKYEEEGRRGKVEVKCDVLALCDAQLLIEDTATRDPGFYLFWRA